ncbi:MAG: hypothetical protein FJ115_04580 [Deltaproteobacteria bacterium]|nr:hypothetical protein [Deltaproteobacteria bacterium]
MNDLTGSLGLLKDRKGFKKNLPLPFPVSNLPDRSCIRIFNGCYPRNAFGLGEFPGRTEKYGGKSRLLQNSCGQSNGLTAEGSGRGEKNRFHFFGFHMF